MKFLNNSRTCSLDMLIGLQIPAFMVRHKPTIKNYRNESQLVLLRRETINFYAPKRPSSRNKFSKGLLDSAGCLRIQILAIFSIVVTFEETMLLQINLHSRVVGIFGQLRRVFDYMVFFYHRYYHFFRINELYVYEMCWYIQSPNLSI